jgi:hypothetical protein
MVTTAVDKWPAYARLSAVAQAGHLPTAPTPPDGTRPATDGVQVVSDRSVEEAYRTAGAPDGVVVVSLCVRWIDRFAWSNICSFVLFSSEGGSATPRFFSAFRVAIPLSGAPERL